MEFNRFIRKMNRVQLSIGVSCVILGAALHTWGKFSFIDGIEYGILVLGIIYIGRSIIGMDVYRLALEKNGAVTTANMYDKILIKKTKVYGVLLIIGIGACIVFMIIDADFFQYSAIPITLYAGLSMLRNMLIHFKLWVLKDELERNQ